MKNSIKITLMVIAFYNANIFCQSNYSSELFNIFEYRNFSPHRVGSWISDIAVQKQIILNINTPFMFQEGMAEYLKQLIMGQHSNKSLMTTAHHLLVLLKFQILTQIQFGLALEKHLTLGQLILGMVYINLLMEVKHLNLWD